MNNELEKIWKEVVVTYVEVVSQHLSGESKKNYKKKTSATIVNFFLIRIVGGGVQLGPLSTSATCWSVVPVPVIVRMENLVEWWLAEETEVRGENLPQCRFVHHNSHMTWAGSQNSSCHGRVSNRRPSEYKTEALSVEPASCVICYPGCPHFNL
jgi:hypothetical protein